MLGGATDGRPARPRRPRVRPRALMLARSRAQRLGYSLPGVLAAGGLLLLRRARGTARCSRSRVAAGVMHVTCPILSCACTPAVNTPVCCSPPPRARRRRALWLRNGPQPHRNPSPTAALLRASQPWLGGGAPLCEFPYRVGGPHLAGPPADAANRARARAAGRGAYRNRAPRRHRRGLHIACLDEQCGATGDWPLPHQMQSMHAQPSPLGAGGGKGGLFGAAAPGGAMQGLVQRRRRGRCRPRAARLARARARDRHRSGLSFAGPATQSGSCVRRAAGGFVNTWIGARVPALRRARPPGDRFARARIPRQPRRRGAAPALSVPRAAAGAPCAAAGAMQECARMPSNGAGAGGSFFSTCGGGSRRMQGRGAVVRAASRPPTGAGRADPPQEPAAQTSHRSRPPLRRRAPARGPRPLRAPRPRAGPAALLTTTRAATGARPPSATCVNPGF